MRWTILLGSLPLAIGVAGATCPPPLEGSGEVRWYIPSMPGNACGLTEPADGRYAAVPVALFEGSARCGECLRIEGPEGVVEVLVTDLCPDCPPDALDLSETAFADIAPIGLGRAPARWTRIACAVEGPLGFTLQSSNPWFLQIGVQDHRYGIAGLALDTGGTLLPMPRTTYNRFEINPPSPVATVTVHVTATTGETLVQALGPVVNDVHIPGSAQFAPCPDTLFVDGFEP